MFLSRIFIAVAVLMSVSVASADVFTNRTRESHELTPMEKQRINREFTQRFGAGQSPEQNLSGNPWKDRKQKPVKRNVNWGECRDYALQMRNLCYKKGQDAFSCERMYEARATKCDEEFN